MPARSQGEPYAQRRGIRHAPMGVRPLSHTRGPDRSDGVEPAPVGVRAAPLPRRPGRRAHRRGCGATPLAFSDVPLMATPPGRTMEPAAMDSRGAVRSGPYAHSVCVQPHEDERKPFTAGIVRVRTTPGKAASGLCDRPSDPSMEADAALHRDLPSDCVCDSGYGIAPSTAIDEGMPPLPDCRALRPGEPTTNTVWTAVEDCTRFEASSGGGCATGAACTPATHMRSERKTEDGRSDG